MNDTKMLYAGTFDPVTNGHLDVIRRASRLCDKLIIGVLKNSAKKTQYTTEQRLEMITIATEGLENVVADQFDGLLADYVIGHGVSAVVRGLRAGVDFEYEIQMAQMNARLYKERAETIFLMTDPSHSFLSSSIVREVWSYGGDIEGLVPQKVFEYMQKLKS
ncbi:MAG: pantetheine-phosphate adenylyltransferase [Clostridiales Family XIII bacterium]|jgi:pantetheine-phosphate adenylyltransferase|nr:pantetheine-phosphate adenylyltransferase [Clostridiales Family XIII bacterium]